MPDGKKRSRRTIPSATYKTGYRRPPTEHQFKPGQSGNRKGRPKGSKNTATLLREILDRKIEVRSSSTVRKISVREAMLTRFTESALKGDTKSAAFLLQRYDAGETAHEQLNEAAPETSKRSSTRTWKPTLEKKEKANDHSRPSVS
jgi:hypothetical protein